MKASNPRAMSQPFTSDEIRTAIMKLNNNKSAGLDGIVAELLKYGPNIIYDEIALIYNTLAETGDCPIEITRGIICALQKPGKTKGPLDHLRPITLLSMLRKTLAICLRTRTIDRLDSKIPPSQAAYRSGRSTTEHIFAVKILCEKVISSKDFTVHLLLLDMSKAFDSVNRVQLINDLYKTLNPDEVEMIKRMLNIELAVKCGHDTSPFFETDTGVPQGDGYSSNEFTFYLANSEYPEEHIDHNYAAPLPTIDHTYAKPESTVEVDIDMEFADDITYITTCKTLRILKKRELPPVLAKRGLVVNETKTEEYSVSREGDDGWKRCKLLGSLLSTAEDIVRRKALAVAAISSKSEIFYSNLDIPMKM